MAMDINSFLSAIHGIAQVETRSFLVLGFQSALDGPLWLCLAAFALGLAIYRRRPRLYASAGLFAAAMALARILPSTTGLDWRFGIAAEACSRIALASFVVYVSERRLPRPVLLGLLGLPALAAGAAIASVFSPGTDWASAAVLVALAVHSIALTGLAAASARGAPSVRFILPVLAPWAVIQGARLIPVTSLAPLLAAGESVAVFLLGAGLILSAMLELARPSPEDVILDDRVARMSASVRRFIPNEFLAQLHKEEVEDLKLGDHIKKEMTIFFSDIRAFTELSESLTPEESFAFINSYLSRVVPLVTDHHGFVDKYMGDAIMALFAETGGADDAVESAIDMQTKMVEYNFHRSKMDYRPISMGIGIHTGTLMLGVVGVSDRMEGTVVSDSVNLASRLQSIAKAFNIPLVISERTFMALSDPGKYKYRFIGKVRVKGKDAPVSAFEIFDGLPAEEFERKMKANTFFEQGILAYYQKDFAEGVFYFKRALESVPNDGASRFYLETCLRKTMTKTSA